MGAKWKGKSVYQLKLKEKRIAGLDTALAELRQVRAVVHEEFVVELGRIIERDPQSIELGNWECEGSPTERCVYDMSTDEQDDACLFCDNPNERK